MSYPFVSAANDYGPRKGPILGLTIHCAEGGGTVGYLDRVPPLPARGVSVHYVIEYTGRIVQMLPESHASGSINPTEIRTTDDADGFFGITAARAVLGDWWRDPNSAVLSLEIEGFAISGPNKAQQTALAALVDDLRTRYPTIGLLGHRDHQSYKPCPGRLIPWAALGGHGPATQETDVPYELKFERWKRADGSLVTTVGAPKKPDGTVDYTSRLAILSGTGGVDRVLESVPRTSLIPVSGSLDDPFYDALTGYKLADSKADVNAALDHVSPSITAAATALAEARPR